jgi:hypothetical protein
MRCSRCPAIQKYQKQSLDPLFGIIFATTKLASNSKDSFIRLGTTPPYFVWGLLAGSAESGACAG